MHRNPYLATDFLHIGLVAALVCIADSKNKGCRRKELLRVREALVDFILYNNEYNTSEDFWQEYFYGFTYAAALERGR